MLSKFSVKKPYTVFVAMILVLILGAISFLNLSTDLLPSLELPYVVVMTSYPGASPEEVETIVTRPIEQLTATINDIKNVSSISSENQSVVILEFNNDVNMDSAIIEINGNLDLIKGAWGDNVASPMILRLNPDMLPIMVASVDIEGRDLKETTRWVDDVLMPQFEGVTGVASVSGEGLLEERVDVIISQEKIDLLNKSILEKTDKSLSEAEDEILKGLAEINNGLDTVNRERTTQNKQLDDGLSAIKTGKEQLILAENEINNGITSLRDNLNSVTLGINEIESKLDDFNRLIAASALGGLGDESSSPENLQMLQAAKTELEEKLAELNSTKTLLSENLRELEKSKDDLNNKKLELFAQEQEVNQGRIMLKTEFDKVESELLEAKSQLEDGYSEFEIAREEAFKQANLDNVITKSMISGILSAQNFSMPAGYISDQDVDYLVKVGDRLATVEEMKSLLLFDTGEDAIGKIYLRDVSDINIEDNSSETYAKVNGNDAVILTMQKQSNYSTSDVSKNIREKIDEIITENPDVNITTLMDQGVYIDIVINSVLNNILYGAILAILILIIFLKDLKPTVIIALSIPISIIFAMAMMYFSGVTINIISMAGLALGVGMLVDNSIVTIENIYRLRNEGLSPGRAAVLGAKEISGAITASTVTTASVFLPIVFTTGISRDLFTDMGLTIAYSLFASLIVALTLVPAMSASMLKNTKEKKYPLLDKFLSLYEKVLRWTLRFKIVVMIFVISLLGLSGYLAYSMGTQFIPDMEAPQISGNIIFDEETPQDEMEDLSDEVVVKISQIKGVDTVGVFRGGAFGGFGGGSNSNSSQISMYIILEENTGVKNSEIMTEIEKVGIESGVQVAVDNRNMDMAALGGTGIEVLVKGRDIDTIRDLAYEVTDILNDLEGTSEVSSGLDRQGLELKVTVNKEKAMENSLTVAQIYSQISNIAGSNRTATTISSKDSDLPVIVIEGKYEEFDRDDLLNLKLNTDNDEEVLLKDIATITDEEGLRSIRRDNQLRYLSVSADISEGFNIGLVGRELQERIDQMDIPMGYTVEIGGEQELINNSLRDLIYMTLLAIVFIYLIMVAQFQSLLSPFIVMFTIPLAFTGGLLTLYLTGNPISLIAMLGFLVLTGVVVNNGIVFVDYTNQLRDRGMDKKEALVLAGKTRMRPILMTAITTILGLSALTFGMGMGAEVLQPLAIVASGGLAYATILTLFVVPVMYDLLHKNKMRRVALMEDELNDI